MSYDMIILYTIFYIMFLISIIILIYNIRTRWNVKYPQEEEFLPPYEELPPSYDLEVRNSP